MTHNAKWGQHQEGSIAALLIDIMETNSGRWYSYEQLVWAAQEVRPGLRAQSVRRTVMNLKTREQISSRSVPSTRGREMLFFFRPDRSYL